MLNAIGLANPGRARFLARDAARAARPRGAALGLGRRLLRPRDYAETCAGVSPRRRRSSSTSPARTSTRRPSRRPRSSPPAARRPSLPLYAKLSPAAWDIAEVARAVEAAGADGLSLVNTIRGLALDERLRPRLARGTGGYSGPALKPIALAAVYACRQATELPIVGMGGVATGRDVLELIACGATDVALGTVLFADPEAPVTGPRRAGSWRSQMPVLTTAREAFCAAQEPVSTTGN